MNGHATTQTCKLNHYSYDMSLASVYLAIVQVASTVAEHLCSLIFSQNYFHIQVQEGKISKFFWGHALDHALSKSILSMFRFM